MPNDPHVNLVVKSTSGKYEDRFGSDDVAAVVSPHEQRLG